MDVLERHEPGTVEWLEQRSARIGGSEIAAILGLSPHESRFSLWHRKQGMVAPTADSPPMEWGRRIEGAVRQKFREQHPELAFEEPSAYTHSERDWMIANPDDLADSARVIIEYKTSDANQSWEWAAAGTVNGVPVWYLCQVRWYMAVLNADTAWLAVLIGGNDYREYPITREAADEQSMIAAGLQFIESLRAGARPDIDAHSATYQAIRDMNPNIEDGSVELPEALASEYLEAEMLLRSADSNLSRIKSLVMDAVGSAKYGTREEEKICERRARRLADGSYGSPWVQLTRKSLTDIKHSLTNRKGAP